MNRKRKRQWYRVFNHSTRALIVTTRAQTEEPRIRHFRLLPGCASPRGFRPIRLQAAEPLEIDGEAVWDLEAPFDVHVAERDPDARSKLTISGFGIRTSEHTWKRIVPDHFLWASRSDDSWVTVLGAGITGLTAAHELVTRGFRVQVIEKAHGSPAELDDDEPDDRTTTAPGATDWRKHDWREHDRRHDDPKDRDVRRFDRGLRRPDVGGIARTQWTTQPLSRGDTPQLAQALPADRLAAMRSVHGDCHWFGSGKIGAMECDDYSAFGVPYRDEQPDPAVATELLEWLRDLTVRKRRSIAAVQLVVVVYREPGDAGSLLTGPAYQRLSNFQSYILKTDSLRDRFWHLEVFPTARIDVDESPVAERYVGLLVRVHEDLGLVAGEHGFRFFPGFYRHLRDTMRRTPIYDPQTRTFTARTTHDNLTEVEWQVFADAERKHTASLLRRPFTSIGGLAEQYRTMRRDLGYRPVDLFRFLLRLLRYMTSSTLRRETYYEAISWWDFLSLRRFDVPTSNAPRFKFGRRFEEALRHAPKALVAMVSDHADARTQGNIAVQLFMDQFDLHEQSDSTLSGPTSPAWLSHWRTYLEHQGVRFFLGEATRIGHSDAVDAEVDDRTLTDDELEAAEAAAAASESPAAGDGVDNDDNGGDEDPDDGDDADAAAAEATDATPRAGVDITFAYEITPRDYVDAEALFRKGKIHAHYYLSAMDIVGLARVTRSFRVSPDAANPSDAPRNCGVLSDLAKLITVDGKERNLEDIAEVGRLGEHHGLDDRFQTLTGIQLYYRSHVSFENGHIYFAASPWGLSAVSQIQYWGPFGGGRRSRLAGNLSVDIGAWRPTEDAPDPNLLRRDEIAKNVQDQILKCLGERQRGQQAAAYYHLDDFIGFTWRDGKLWPTRNHAPFLINRVNDWCNRPCGDPWVPNDVRMRDRKPGQGKTSPEGIWCHDRSGYPVHFGNLVIAGTHMRTFTRMATMEAANESARHAVNAILDHLSFAHGRVRTPPPPDGPVLQFQSRPAAAMEAVQPLFGAPMPGGGHRDPPRTADVDKVTTPYGDYCDIWNLETHEFPDLDFLRLVDEHLMKATIDNKDDRPEGPPPIAPHLFDVLRIDELPDCVEGDREALGAFELIGSALSAFTESSCDSLPSVFSIVETVREKLTALLERKK
jgi:hypothetical protein